jgi:hypothetical protein
MKLKPPLLRVGLLTALLSPLPLPAAFISPFVCMDVEYDTPSRVYPAHEIAQSFVVGDTDCTFKDVWLRMGREGGSPSGFYVELWSADPGNSYKPLGSLVRLTGEANPTVDNFSADYEYTGTYSLTHNTTYYVVARAETGDSADYFTWYGHANAPIGAGSTRGYSVDNGISWSSPDTGYVAYMQVDASTTPVPEPGSWVMLGLVSGVTGAAVLERRRRR